MIGLSLDLLNNKTLLGFPTDFQAIPRVAALALGKLQS